MVVIRTSLNAVMAASKLQQMNAISGKYKVYMTRKMLEH